MQNITFDWKAYAEISRNAIAEGVVLVKNDNNLLPLRTQKPVSVFGRIQFDYIKSGTGSGGLVNAPYVVGIVDGLRNQQVAINEQLESVYQEWLLDNPFDHGNGWAQEAWFQKEMPLSAQVMAEARAISDTALVVLGRLAGEDKDNSAKEGSYFLTQAEHDMLKMVTQTFTNVVVILNVGNIIDMEWVETYNPSAVLYAWQGGAEGGNGVADVLLGKTCPSGKLSDTIARDINDYPSTANFGDGDKNIYAEDIYVGYRYFETFAPEKVRYPFGFGLSYTTFSLQTTATVQGDTVTFAVQVTNTGAVAGKEVVQVYVQAPQGKLGKPARGLVAFAKTETLAPNASTVLELSVALTDCASYDDSGVTGNRSCFVLEAGDYAFYVGTDVRTASLAITHTLPALVVTQTLSQACAPVQAFDVLKPALVDGKLMETYVPVTQRDADYVPFTDKIPLPDLPYTGDMGYKLYDVQQGKVTLDAYLAQISDTDLICMTRGEGMCSPKVTAGTAGAFGGVSDGLVALGMPVACCADGPSGIRMDVGDMAFSLPNGTLLACSFNVDLSTDLFAYLGMELRLNKIETVLGPGMNIHRSPLNGRNFEYFSEDPLLTGKIGAAQLQGLHQHQVTGTIKHYATNNQEYRRVFADSVLSERALREIYLKGFEIAVREGNAYSIMTAYNPLNGVWTAGNHDLVTRILREEWGYDGIVMTDWWAKMNWEGEQATTQNTGAMIKAQNDLFMVTANAQANSGKDNSQACLDEGKISRGHLLRCARNLCNFMLRTQVVSRLHGADSYAFTQLHRVERQAEDVAFLGEFTPTKAGISLPVAGVSTQKGHGITFDMCTPEMGTYTIELAMHADIVGVAQIPLSLYHNNHIFKTLVINSENAKNGTFSFDFESGVSISSYFKLYFGESGLQFDRITMYQR